MLYRAQRTFSHQDIEHEEVLFAQWYTPYRTNVVNSQIVDLATNTLTLLQPYLPAMATAAAVKVGEKIPSEILRIWDVVRGKFSSSPSAQETLDDLLQNPTDPDFLAAFRARLRKFLETDGIFFEELSPLVPEVINSVGNIHQQGHANFTINGTNNRVDQRIGQIADNITNVGFQPKQIPPYEIDSLLTSLRQYPPLKALITSNLLNDETAFLARQLTQLLQNAGWDASGDTKEMYGPDMPKGIFFFADAKTPSLINLASKIGEMGFKSYVHVDPKRPILTIHVHDVG